MGSNNNDSEHTKYFNSKGVEVPSCTTIVGLLNKPELVGWANYMGFRKINTNKFLQMRAEYGTCCHSIAEQYLNGILSYNPNEYSSFMSYEEYNELLSKLKYISRYLSNNNMRIVSTELEMHGERFGGTSDLLCLNEITGEFILLDYKTSKRIYDSHFIQLGGYSILLEEIFGIHIGKVGIILLSKNETDRDFFNIIPRDKNRNREKIFDKLLDIYWLQNVREQ